MVGLGYQCCCNVLGLRVWSSFFALDVQDADHKHTAVVLQVRFSMTSADICDIAHSTGPPVG